jgi:drug/metabolite transporter (DMT)-like permease
MFAETWTKFVITSVAPVVVISASGLLCLAFYNRLAAIVSRLRSVQRERLQEVNTYRAALARNDAEAVESHRRLLHNLREQTHRIIQRARLIRITLLCLLGTVALLVISSLLNGLALFWPSAAIGAAIVFALGMFSLLTGVLFAMRELAAALDVVQLESSLVGELTEFDGDTLTAHNDGQPRASFAVCGTAAISADAGS